MSEREREDRIDRPRLKYDSHSCYQQIEDALGKRTYGTILLLIIIIIIIFSTSTMLKTYRFSFGFEKCVTHARSNRERRTKRRSAITLQPCKIDGVSQNSRNRIGNWIHIYLSAPVCSVRSEFRSLVYHFSCALGSWQLPMYAAKKKRE